MEYHALIAGMPVVSAGDEKPKVTVAQFKADYMPQLTESDRKLVGLYLLRYDNRNLLSLLDEKEAWDDRGLYSSEQLTEAIEAARKDDHTSRKLPAYIYEFVTVYDGLKEGDLAEDELARLYFGYVLATKNKFAKSWFEFERDTNNLFTMFTGQKHGFDARASLIGDDEVTEALRTSTLPDFGLSTSLAYYAEIRRIAMLDDAVDIERELDAYRYKWLADGTFFYYFTVEKLFAYVIMLDIIERWCRLDAEKGQQVFRDLIGDISKGAELPEEFR